VKEVKAHGARYVVCRNEAEAEKDRADRRAIITGLEKQLRKGDKALIGNSAYRRYLRRVRTEDATRDPAFAIDPGKLAPRDRPEAGPRAGLRLATTASSCCAPTPASRRCRRCCATGTCCRSRTCSAGPRQCCAPGRSIIPRMPLSVAMCSARSSRWCCRRSWPIAAKPPASPSNGQTWCAIDRLQEATIDKDSKRITMRTPVTGQVGRVFQATGVALPPNTRDYPA
jgi:hypothetical protein